MMDLFNYKRGDIRDGVLRCMTGTVNSSVIYAAVGDNITIPWPYITPDEVHSVRWTMNTSGVDRTVLYNGTGIVINVTSDNLRYDSNLGQVTITNASLNNTGLYTITVSYLLTSSSPLYINTVELIVCKAWRGPYANDVTTPDNRISYNCMLDVEGSSVAMDLYIKVDGLTMHGSSHTVTAQQTVDWCVVGECAVVLNGFELFCRTIQAATSEPDFLAN